MATKRSTFQKRQRETDLKDKARAKEERRALKRAGLYVPKDADVEAANRAEVPETGPMPGISAAPPPPLPDAPSTPAPTPATATPPAAQASSATGRRPTR